jgi:sulfatase modifying factor 1
LEYALPTEEQWEFAARAGAAGTYGASSQPSALVRVAWTQGRLPEDRLAQPQPVGIKEPNAFGLHDTLGNVWEWCAGWQTGHENKRRALRGGGWSTDATRARPAQRGGGEPGRAWDAATRFRVAIVGKLPSSSPSSASSPSPAVAPFDAGQAKQHQETWAKQLSVSVEQTNTFGMKLRLIPPGEFIMGAKPDARFLAPSATWYFARWVLDRRQGEEPEHTVHITRPIFWSVHEVTVEQFSAFIKETSYRTEAEQSEQGGFGWADGSWQRKPTLNWKNPGFPQTPNHPVGNISWHDAVAFCEWLSKQEGQTYRLPTEAEWEYACRAGTTSPFSSGSEAASLEGCANVADKALRAASEETTWATNWDDGFAFTAPVGSFRANPWGLYDMHGNVPVWCSDFYDATYYASSPTNDPAGPTKGDNHVFRGGAWDSWVGFVRSSDRYGSHSPTLRTTWAGFRVICEDCSKPVKVE